LILYVTDTGSEPGLVNVTDGEAPFWHTAVVPEIVAEGEGLTVTVVEAADEGPLQPSAVTETVAVPENEGDHVTVPVVPVPEIVFPVPVTDHV
jgi:hypothetical protein